MGILRSRDGAAGSAILMVLAFVSVGSFMYWLNTQAAELEVVVDETDTPTQSMGMAFSEFASDPSAHMVADVSVRGVEVASLMGDHQFWTQLDPNTPFLVRLNPAVVTGGFAFVYGDALSVKGRVHAMSDSVLDSWVAGGTMTDDQRFEAEFAESFLEVSEASH
jgi:hypothetical protein